MNIYIPKFNPRTSLERILSLLWGETNDQVPHTRLEKAIYEIARGGKVLPSVSTTDAGKVLTVGEDGAWAPAEGGIPVPDIEAGDVGKVLTAGEDGAVWASGGGGGDESTQFFITVSPGEAEGTFVVDVTSAEMEAAYAAEKQFVIVMESQYGKSYMNVTDISYSENDGDEIISLQGISVTADLTTDVMVITCINVVSQDNTVSVEYANYKPYTLTPVT